MRGHRRFQFRLKALLMAILVCAAVLGVTTTVCRIYQSTISSVEDYYALSQVADMLIHYINDHQGESPNNWQDLEAAYQYVNSGYNNFSFRELRQRVGIDFDRLALVLKACLREASDAGDVRLIFARNTGRSLDAEAEANRRLWDAIVRHQENKRERKGVKE
jgi:hypothetical protein